MTSSMTSSMSTYKCRADCSADILKVLKAYRNWLVINDYENDLKTIKMEKLYLKGAGIDGADVFCGEMEWTFSIDTGQYDWTADDGLDFLKLFITESEDTHVMVQTLEVEADYTGIRKY